MLLPGKAMSLIGQLNALPKIPIEALAMLKVCAIGSLSSIKGTPLIPTKAIAKARNMHNFISVNQELIGTYLLIAKVTKL